MRRLRDKDLRVRFYDDAINIRYLIWKLRFISTVCQSRKIDLQTVNGEFEDRLVE